MTQGEINEAANDFAREIFGGGSVKLTEDIFKAGVNFAQSKLYSEKDVISFALYYFEHQGKSIEHWGKDIFEIWKKEIDASIKTK